MCTRLTMHECFCVFTTGKLIRSIRTVRVIVTLLFLGDALVVTTAKLVRRADGWRRAIDRQSVS